MEVRVLEYFLAVAREQSISGAADVLHLTQPTLSRQLKELEDELGKQLMIRGSRRITLTEDGMLLRKRAEEIVSLVRRTRDEVMNNTEEASGDVYIGAGETRCMSIFADVMTDIRRECPGIRFHTVSGDSADIMERLDKGLFDFCLIMGNVDISRYNSLRIPARDEFGLLMRQDSPLASREYITPADLDGIPLMFSRQVLIRDDFADWLGKPTADLDLVGQLQPDLQCFDNGEIRVVVHRNSRRADKHCRERTCVPAVQTGVHDRNERYMEEIPGVQPSRRIVPGTAARERRKSRRSELKRISCRNSQNG